MLCRNECYCDVRGRNTDELIQGGWYPGLCLGWENARGQSKQRVRGGAM